MKKKLTRAFVFSIVVTAAFAVYGAYQSAMLFINNEPTGQSQFYKIEADSKKVMVFVHGVIGTAEDTWNNSQENIFWPEIIANDERFNSYDLFIVSYYTPLAGQAPNIYQLAGKLNTTLRANGIYTKRGEGASKYNEVVFVGHSMGNLVIRTSMIIAPPEEYVESIPLILSIAAPSSGSNAAQFVDKFTDTPTFNDMATLQQNSFLSLMNKTWSANRFDTEIACAYEKKATKGVMIVEKKSATSICTRPIIDSSGIDEDHEAIVKPDSKNHAVHQWLWKEISADRSRKGWELARWENEIIIAGKDYTESNIHLAMMALVIEQEFAKDPNNKIKVTRQYEAGNGLRLQGELKSERIDMYAEYSGSQLFAYLGVDPIEMSNSLQNDKALIERQHTVEKLNEVLRNADTNMEYYPLFGFNSPFKLVMLKQDALELGLLKNGKVKMSEFASLSNKFELGGGTDFFYRSDGYIGLKQFYKDDQLGFSHTRYIKHTKVYDELLNSKRAETPLVIVGHGTDHELFEVNSVFVVIEDDKGFFPIHRAGPIGHRFLSTKFPQVRTALRKLEGVLSEREMAELLVKGNEIWDVSAKQSSTKKHLAIEGLARQFLLSKGILE